MDVYLILLLFLDVYLPWLWFIYVCWCVMLSLHMFFFSTLIRYLLVLVPCVLWMISECPLFVSWAFCSSVPFHLNVHLTVWFVTGILFTWTQKINKKEFLFLFPPYHWNLMPLTLHLTLCVWILVVFYFKICEQNLEDKEIDRISYRTRSNFSKTLLLFNI